MAMEATGKLHTIFETKQVSERFTKREFVIELADNPKYPQVVLFQLTGDRCAQLDGMRVGDAVRIEFSLRGREWRNPQGEVKYFNSLDVWRVEPAHAQGGARRDSRGRAPAYDDDAPRGRAPASPAASYPGGYDDAPPRTDEPRPRDEVGRDGDDLPF
jgi:single-stranded DNA-binding protein